MSSMCEPRRRRSATSGLPPSTATSRTGRSRPTSSWRLPSSTGCTWRGCLRQPRSAVVERLASLAGDTLIVEWVDPARSGHRILRPSLVGRRDQIRPLQSGSLRAGAGAPFRARPPIGDVSPTRRLLLASKRRHDIDLRCPLPLRHPAGTVVSSSLLTVHGGVEHWSRVYDLGDRVEKRATGTLAVREAAILGRFAGGLVPRVLDASESVDASVLTLEKIAGQPLADALPAIAASRASFRGFLAALRQSARRAALTGIAHKDIRAENLMVRDGRPVLLDFGWATAPGSPIFTPDGFGSAHEQLGRPGAGFAAPGRLPPSLAGACRRRLDGARGPGVPHRQSRHFARARRRRRAGGDRRRRAGGAAGGGGPGAQLRRVALSRRAT